MKTGRNTLTKRLVAILLSILMVLQMMPMTNFAIAEGEGSGWQDGAKATRSGETFYTVKFYEGSEELTQIIVEDGTLSVLPENPFKEGFRFKEWNTESDGTGSKVEQGRTITGNLDVYAIFEEIKVYQVSVDYWYTSQYDEGGKHVFETQIYEFDNSKPLPYTIMLYF